MLTGKFWDTLTLEPSLSWDIFKMAATKKSQKYEFLYLNFQLSQIHKICLNMFLMVTNMIKMGSKSKMAANTCQNKQFWSLAYLLQFIIVNHENVGILGLGHFQIAATEIAKKKKAFP